MSITVKKITFPEHEATNSIHLSENHSSRNYLDLVKDIEVSCQIRLGTITLTIAELQQLQQGQTLTLNEYLQEPLDIMVNNQVIARGELMSHDDYYAIRITEVTC